MAFQVGEIVVARSGGPKMTVETVITPGTYTTDRVACVWFSGNDADGWTLFHEMFSINVLMYPVVKEASPSIIDSGNELLAKGNALVGKFFKTNKNSNQDS